MKEYVNRWAKPHLSLNIVEFIQHFLTMVADLLMKKIINHLGQTKGQAVFELIAFIPFLIFIFTIMVTIGNSINASINQQKVTRRYFYYLIKGNSTAPVREDLNTWLASGINLAGITALGFRAKEESRSSFAACFKLNTLFVDPGAETCDEPNREDSKSYFIRVYTYYGFCGETYINRQGYYRTYHNYPYQGNVSNIGACTLQ